VLAVVKVEAERRASSAVGARDSRPDQPPPPGAVSPLPRLVGSSLSALLTLAWLLGRQRVGVGQAPLDPAAQILLLGAATGPAGEAVDVLPGREGAFLACTFWLADNYALVGRPDDARSLFRRLLDLRNDVGLLAEEYDPVAGRQLGNFPQAFSHVPLINTAMHLSEAGPDPRYLRFENEREDAAR
jgi:Glycosyl hydrolases family 15